MGPWSIMVLHEGFEIHDRGSIPKLCDVDLGQINFTIASVVSIMLLRRSPSLVHTKPHRYTIKYLNENKYHIFLSNRSFANCHNKDTHEDRYTDGSNLG